MSSQAYTPLPDQPGNPPTGSGLMRQAGEKSKKVCGYCCGLAVLLYLLLIFLNFCFFWVMTLGCGPNAIGENYRYPGGGKSDFGGPAYNLLPQDLLMSEREHTFWGWPLDVIPANVAATASAAQVGTWWRNKGVIFYSYSYEDIINSKLTLYMRANFWTYPILSYKIARCDGKGPVVTLTESGHWLTNKFRSIFRLNQAQTFSVYVDSDLIFQVQEVSGSTPSLTITNATTGDEVASSLLNNRHFHGNKDQWYVHNKDEEALPYWISSAVTLPFAFDQIETKAAQAKKSKDDSDADKFARGPDLLAVPDAIDEAAGLATGSKDERLVEVSKAEQRVDQAVKPEQHV